MPAASLRLFCNRAPVARRFGLLMAVLLLALLGGGGARAAALPEPIPAMVTQALPEAYLRGQAQMRVWGLRIYHARLWVTPAFDPQAFTATPLALELRYQRAFKGAAIAQRSIEEMQRQQPIAAPLAQRWQAALTAVFPDVQAGERLTGVYEPHQGLRFWHDQQPLAPIDDAELARRFYAIWLSPQTSAPSLRRALLGEASAP